MTGIDASGTGRIMGNEIDLHGCTRVEALEMLIRFYNDRVRRSNRTRFDVIHGYGSSGTGGTLRTCIRNFLGRHADYLRFEPGENYSPANPGKTLIIPMKELPDAVDILAEEILEYCVTPRTLSKISGKFRRYGDGKVQAALKNLEKQGAVSSFFKGQYRHYQANQS